MELKAGTTVHLLSGSKYKGPAELLEVGAADANGWQHIKFNRAGSSNGHAWTAEGLEWFTRAEDAFASEAEAREAARERRQPRRQRSTPYGDYGALAAFLGANR